MKGYAKIRFLWDRVDDFCHKMGNIRSNSRKKMRIFCLLNDLKFLNAEINAVKSRYNIKLTLLQLYKDLSSQLSDTQGRVVF